MSTDHSRRPVPMGDRLGAELERHFQASRWRDENDLVRAPPDRPRPSAGSANEPYADAARPLIPLLSNPALEIRAHRSSPDCAAS